MSRDGACQQPGQRPGYGAWFIRVRKSDCRVDRYGVSAPDEIPAEVKAMIVAARKANADKGLPEPDLSSKIERDRALAALAARRRH